MVDQHEVGQARRVVPSAELPREPPVAAVGGVEDAIQLVEN